LKHVLKLVLSAVNFVCAQGRDHKQFVCFLPSFLRDVKTEYENLSYYTYAGEMFCAENSRNEFNTFAEVREEEKVEIKITNWVQDLDLSI
jgi:hypothetical protein